MLTHTFKGFHVPAARTALGLACAALASLADAWTVPGPEEWPAPSATPLASAEVQAELLRWRAEAPLRALEEASGVMQLSPSTRTRAQVRDEAVAARASGQNAVLMGEPHNFAAEPSLARRDTETARR
jgi:hypothetical protein